MRERRCEKDPNSDVKHGYKAGREGTARKFLSYLLQVTASARSEGDLADRTLGSSHLPAGQRSRPQIPRSGETEDAYAPHCSARMARESMLRLFSLLFSAGTGTKERPTATAVADDDTERFVVRPLVPSADPDTPTTLAELFDGIPESDILPAYYDTPYDPSLGVPSTDDGEPVGEDATLFWEIATGKEPLIQKDGLSHRSNSTKAS
jgi:hypothetical protein